MKGEERIGFSTRIHSFFVKETGTGIQKFAIRVAGIKIYGHVYAKIRFAFEVIVLPYVSILAKFRF